MVEDIKTNVAMRALTYIQDGMIVGLGTGTTASIFVELLGKKVSEEKLSITGIATSNSTYLAAKKFGIPMIDINNTAHIDLTVDGADEVDPNLDLIKGNGGALLREKIVAMLSDKFIVIVDETKIVQKLGEKGFLPVEYLSIAESLIYNILTRNNISFRVRMQNNTNIITDNGNFIMDVAIRPGNIKTYHGIIKSIPGIIETGFFPNIADEVLIGFKNGSIKKLVKNKKL